MKLFAPIGWNDPELPFLRGHRTLARHEHVFAEVAFALHVVVVAVHRVFVDRERLGDHAASRTDHGVHHRLPVAARVVLRPADRFDVVVEVAAALGEIREVAIRQVRDVLPHVGLREFDEQAADRIADATRAAVQHEPHVVRFVDAHFDEVIAGAERAEMRVVVRLFQLRILVDDPLEARLQRLPRFGHGGRRAVAPRARIAAARRAAVRHRAFDRAAQPRERIRQVGCRQRRARGHHPAADVDADRGRNDRALGRNHAADRRPCRGGRPASPRRG